MGKRKKKTPSKSDDAPPIPSTIFPPQLTKEFFIILSLGGHLNPTDYNELLDEIESSHGSNNYHDDDDLDDILNVMDIFEQKRQSFASSIASLACNLLSAMNVKIKQQKENNQQSSTNSDFHHNSSYWMDEEKWILNIEEASYNLRNHMVSYKPVLRNQRHQLKKCQQQLVLNVHSHQLGIQHSSYDSHDQPDGTLEYVVHRIKMINEYKSTFLSLIQEFKHQLHWESILMKKLEDVLNNEHLYSWYCDVNDHDDDGLTDGDHIDFQPTYTLYQDLMQWSKTVEQCLLLDKQKWKNVKEFILVDTVKYCKSMRNNNLMDNDDSKDGVKDFAKDDSTHTNSLCDNNSVSYMQPETSCIVLQNQKILSSSSIEEAMNIFLDRNMFDTNSLNSDCLDNFFVKEKKANRSKGISDDSKTLASRLRRKVDICEQSNRPLFLLLVGASNSGKSYFCQNLRENIIDDNIKVICPRLPSDFLGSTVGSGEESLLSLFTHATDTVQTGRKCIILLDGLEEVLGETNYTSGVTQDIQTESKNESHVTLRMKSMFVNIIERMKMDDESHLSLTNLLIICTCRSCDDRYSDRFDKVFYLSDPDWDERYKIVHDCIGLSSYLDDNVKNLIARAATSLMGKSRGEIALYCREVMYDTSHVEGQSCLDDMTTARRRLELLHKFLQTTTPESLKQLSSDESIEMRVSSSSELNDWIKIDDNGDIIFPLFGKNAQDAWRQLRNTIVAPLCQSQQLEDILYGQIGGNNMFAKKGITCGALITGAPGVGKTAIAYQCAAIAATLEPTLRLLEVSCTSLVSKEVGSSEKNISKLFKTARSATPCIILLDGLENIAPVRGNDNTTEGTMDRLLSTLLTEMDGIMHDSDDSMAKGIGIIGITHNPSTWIDPAILRPGRLEKCIHLDFPDISARKEILTKEMKDLFIDFSKAGYFDPKDKNQLVEYIATKTDGKSAAEIIATSKNARMLAIRHAILDGKEDPLVEVDHFLQVARNKR